jgi:ABC-2 type transport system permease protein
MSGLVRAEISRFLARRVTVVMLIIIAALGAFIALGFASSSSNPTTGEYSRAEGLATAARAVWNTNRDACLDVERGTRAPEPGKTYPPNCDYGPEPTADQFLDYGFSFRRQWPELYITAAVILGLFGFVVGASFIGAEWTSGGMTNLLLWRPQRAAVLGAKFAVAVGGVLAISIVYLIVWTIAFLGVGAVSGVVGHLSGGEVASLLLTGVRVVLLGAFGAAVGFAIASVGRHTAVAMGIGIAYLIVYELGARLLFEVADSNYPERLFLSTHVAAWLIKRLTVSGGGYSCDGGGCFADPSRIVTWGEGGAVLTVVTAALVGAAFLSMRRRDIT